MHNKNNIISRVRKVCARSLPLSCALTVLISLAGTPDSAHAVYRDARFAAAPQLNQLIVKYRDAGMDASSRSVMSSSVLEKVSGKTAKTMQHTRWLALGAQLVSVGDSDKSVPMADVIDALEADPRVEYVVRDVMYQPAAVPSDPLFAEQWHYSGAPGSISLTEAWSLAYPAGFAGESRLAPVVVAVIDSGSRPHEDLLENTLPGYDFIANPFVAGDGNGRDADATDVGDFTNPGDCGPNWPGSRSVWHGAHVMGTVGAVTNNGIGGAGVAPNARIVPIRTLGRCGGALSDVIDSIYWAAGIDVPGAPPNENPAKVINLSLAAPGVCNAPMQAAVTAARNAGAVVVAAAGNEAIDASNLSPANCLGAFTVAAVHAGGGRAIYSNFGNVVEIAAPGGNGPVFNPPDAGVISTVDAGLQIPVEDAYGSLTGTSMAAPHVAGVAAMVFGAQPNWTPAQVENLLIATARDFPQNCNGCGQGIVDAAKALETALPPLVEEVEEEELLEEPVEELIEEEVEEEEPIGLPLEPQLPYIDIGLSVLSSVTSVVQGGEQLDDNGRPLTQRMTEYAIAVRNLSLVQAEAVVVTNTIPEGVELVNIEISQGVCEADGSRCEVGNVGALEQVQMSLAVTHFGPRTVDALFGFSEADLPGEALYIETQVVANNADQAAENNTLVQPLVAGHLSWLGVIGLVLMAAWRRGLRCGRGKRSN